MSRLTRKTFVQTNYDATACYDRIVPNLAVPLERASCHVRTDLGMSKEKYTHTNENPIFGTGQGSGNSPAIWCFLSSLLYNCYDEEAITATYCFPDKTERIHFGMVGFVDDSNGQTNAFSDKESQTKLTRSTIRYKRMRSTGPIYCGLLEALWSYQNVLFMWPTGFLQVKEHLC
jgi:hypothetical protein